MIYRGTFTCPVCGGVYNWIHETRQQLYNAPLFSEHETKDVSVIQFAIEDSTGNPILVGDCPCGAHFVVPYIP